MRNLKRALSLAMATVMLMSMTVISAGALSFNDADDISDVSAATVLEALEVMVGDDAGNFNPDEVVTRAEMATILCRVVYGVDYEADGYIGLTTFTDISGHWGEAAISMAYANGWINGKDAETFDPNATVLAYEAYVMIQRALGYYDVADTTAYALGTYAMTLASKTGISSGITTGAYTGLTRDAVATAVYNAMFDTPKVAYSSWTGIYYACDVAAQEDDGTVVNWTPDITSPSIAIGFGTKGTFAADVHDVTIKTGYDVMGRPVDEVYVDGTSGFVATSPIDADEIFVAGAEFEDIDDAIDDDALAGGGSSNIYYNGTKDTAATSYKIFDTDSANTNLSNIRTNDGDAELKNGYVVEVYDVDDTITYVVYYYLIGEIVDIDYDEDEDETTLRIDSASKKYYVIDGDVTDVYDEDDMVMFTFGSDKAALDGTSTDPYAIDTIEFATTIEGEATGVSTDSYWYIDGTKYSKADKYTIATIDDTSVAVGDEVALYLDPNGYVIATEIIDGVATAYDYLYVTDASWNLGTASVKVLFADGTESIITIDEVANNSCDGVGIWGTSAYSYDGVSGSSAGSYIVSENKVYEYDENDDGTYDLVLVTTAYIPGDNIMIENGYTRPLAKSGGYATFNSKSAYFTDETVFVDAYDNEIFVGYENVSDYNNSDGYIDAGNVMAVVDGSDIVVIFLMDGAQDGTADAGTYVYVDDASAYYLTTIDDDTYAVYTSVYVDGVNVDVITETTSSVGEFGNGASGTGDHTAYEITVDDDGYVTYAAKLADSDYVTNGYWTGVTTAGSETKFNSGDDFFMSDLYVSTVGSSYIATTTANDGVTSNVDYRYSYDSDTIFVYIDEDGDVFEGSKSDIITNTYTDDFNDDGTADDYGFDDEFTLIHVVCDEDNYAIVVFIEVCPASASSIADGTAVASTAGSYFAN